jgi:hypothetical protein
MIYTLPESFIDQNNPIYALINLDKIVPPPDDYEEEESDDE